MQHYDTQGMSPDQIAASLERDRDNLSQSISGLRDRLSVDSLISDATNYAQANIGPYARALDGAVRANPLAAVMIGVGLAWLAFGQKRGAGQMETPLAGTKFEAMSRWEDEGGPVAPLPSPQDTWMIEADRLRNRASGALSRIDRAARARLSPAAEVARERAEVLANLAKTTRSAMLRGLENMTADAQSRILAAREEAYVARNAVVRQGTKLIEDQPVTAGAIAMAIGAAVAAVLPRTETEDRLFGAERDQLLVRAQDALRHERDRAGEAAMRVADGITAEVKDSARNLVSETL